MPIPKPHPTCSTITLERSVHAATIEPSGDALNANTAKDTTLSPKAFRLTRSDSCPWNRTCCPHNEDSTTKKKDKKLEKKKRESLSSTGRNSILSPLPPHGPFFFSPFQSALVRSNASTRKSVRQKSLRRNTPYFAPRDWEQFPGGQMKPCTAASH